MVKQAPTGPMATLSASVFTPTTSFPSPPLVLLNILSCFLATAAFASALTQINTWAPWILAIVPPSIGFLATVPFHFFLYAFVQRHAGRTRNGLSFEDISSFPMWCFVYIYLLVALWLIILILEILCCVSGGSLGVVMTTIFAGLECIVSVFLAIKCVLESWDVEDIHNKNRKPVVPPGSDAEAVPASMDDATLNSGSPTYLRPTPKYLYLVSWLFATLAFICSISPWFSLIVDIPTYILTVIVHVPMFVSSGSLKRSTAQPWFGSVGVSFLLVVLWCGFVLVNILGNILALQRALAGIFGVAECVVVGYITMQCVMESIYSPRGQIQLEGD